MDSAKLSLDEFDRVQRNGKLADTYFSAEVIDSGPNGRDDGTSMVWLRVIGRGGRSDDRAITFHSEKNIQMGDSVLVKLNELWQVIDVVNDSSSVPTPGEINRPVENEELRLAERLRALLSGGRSDV